MYYYSLPSLPEAPCISESVRGAFLVATLEPLIDETPLSPDALANICYNGRVSVQGWRLEYSLRGVLYTPDMSVLDSYIADVTPTDEGLMFQMWVSTYAEKETAYADLIGLVEQHGGEVNWHVCADRGTKTMVCQLAERHMRGL